MKTLAESIFGRRDVIDKDVNMTISAAENIIIQSLEDKLKMKCIDLDITHVGTSMRLWDANKWSLVTYHSTDTTSGELVIYLQYNLTRPNDDYSIRFITKFYQKPDEPDGCIEMHEIGIELYQEFSYEIGTFYAGSNINKHIRLADNKFTAHNTPKITKYLDECFADFKQRVESDEFVDIFENIYRAHEGKNMIRYENLAYHKLRMIFEKIVK